MQFPNAGPLTASVLFTVAGLAGPPTLGAQTASARRSPDFVAIRLASLSRERAVRWSQTAPVILCGPAPLTERPTASAEFARPAVVPLESAFLDAARVKRTIAARAPVRPTPTK